MVLSCWAVECMVARTRIMLYVCCIDLHVDFVDEYQQKLWYISRQNDNSLDVDSDDCRPQAQENSILYRMHSDGRSFCSPVCLERNGCGWLNWKISTYIFAAHNDFWMSAYGCVCVCPRSACGLFSLNILFQLVFERPQPYLSFEWAIQLKSWSLAQWRWWCACALNKMDVHQCVFAATRVQIPNHGDEIFFLIYKWVDVVCQMHQIFS